MNCVGSEEIAHEFIQFYFGVFLGIYLIRVLFAILRLMSTNKIEYRIVRNHGHNQIFTL